MFDPDLVSDGIPPGRDVTQGPHVLLAGAAHLVADHPVVQGHSAADQPVGGRTRSDANHHQVGRQQAVVTQSDLRDPAVGAADLRDPDPGAHVDALGPMHPGDQLPDPLTEHPRQRGRLRLDERHSHPE